MKKLFQLLLMVESMLCVTPAISATSDQLVDMPRHGLRLKVEVLSPSHLDELVTYFNGEDFKINPQAREAIPLTKAIEKEHVAYLDPVSKIYYEQKGELKICGAGVINETHINSLVAPTSLSAYIQEKEIEAQNGFKHLFVLREPQSGSETQPIKGLVELTYTKGRYSFAPTVAKVGNFLEKEKIELYKALLEKYIPVFHKEEPASAKFPVTVLATDKNFLDYLLSFKMLPQNAQAAFFAKEEVPRDGKLYKTEINGYPVNVQYLSGLKMEAFKFNIIINGKLPLTSVAESFKDIKIELQ